MLMTVRQLWTFTNSIATTGTLIGIDDDENCIINNKENTNLIFKTNNDTKMTILSNGM